MWSSIHTIHKPSAIGRDISFGYGQLEISENLYNAEENSVSVSAVELFCHISSSNSSKMMMLVVRPSDFTVKGSSIVLARNSSISFKEQEEEET
jgi:hypothetical protein